MPVSDATHAPQIEQDLGPLAWVLTELRKTLDGAVKLLQHYARDVVGAAASDLAAPDTATLRSARQMLHQCGGALTMVGMEPTAVVLQAMEAAVQGFVQQPERCGDQAVAVLERASFAVVEYLESVLSGASASPVALFPQYRQVQALSGVARVHPVDLWPQERRLRAPVWPADTVQPVAYDVHARARLDSAVLGVVKNGDPLAAADLQQLCLGLAAAQQAPQLQTFWRVSAGFFEALARRWLTPDGYVKRTTSRLLMQYTALARGETQASGSLLRELLFFCAQAKVPGGAAPSEALAPVRATWEMPDRPPVDYEAPRFGLFDPALLAQARKRIAAATETWSALAGGDRHKIKPAADQFSLVCDSLGKLNLDSEPLAEALMRAAAVPLRTAEPPAPALAMEVATAVLYLQASFEEIDAAREHMAERALRLARRLDRVTLGGESAPLEPWMEELYRRVSDHQTMGSVVDELRVTLGEAEKSLDQYFRDPSDTTPLSSVPGGMQQMRGVLSVLGLEEASRAVLRMREVVEHLLAGEVEPADQPAAFGRLGNSLGALGFLVDMLGYQRTMAAKLFVYDEERGELVARMGRTRVRAGDSEDEAARVVALRAGSEAPAQVVAAPEPQPVAEPAVAEAPPPSVSPEAVEVPADVAPPPAAAPAPDPELLEIFLDEAREVVEQGLAAVAALANDPGELQEQTALRRAFHTLKGSSRMVGLGAFGDAAWAMEEVLNAWLVQQKPATQPLIALSRDALNAFGRWVRDLAAGSADHWSAQGFRASADAMCESGVWLALAAPGEPPVAAEPPTPSEEALPEVPEEVATVDAVQDEDGPQTLLEAPLEADFADTMAEAQLVPQAPVPSEPLEAAAPGAAEDEVKVIGTLRVPIALYNVYLNEADEWSRRLVTSLQEWGLELAQGVPEEAVAMAHSLAGSSATVGFTALSQLARTLEHALQHLELAAHPLAGQAQVVDAAAEEIRRLLHQFAAGFLKEPQPHVSEQLEALLQSDVASGAAPLPGADDATGDAPDAFEQQRAIGDAIAPTAAAGGASRGEDDAIDAIDAIDLDLFPIFEEEAQELLPALGAALRQWSSHPGDMGARGELLRALHTLKGSARLAGALHLGEMAHRMESAVEQIDTDTVTAAHIEPLLTRLDALQANFSALRAVDAQAQTEPETALAVPPAQQNAATPAAGADRDGAQALVAPAATQAQTLQARVQMARSVARPAAGQQVRVRSQLLDRLVNGVGEVLIARTRLASRVDQMRSSLGDLSGNLDRLRTQLRDIEVQAETQMQSRQAQSRDNAAGFDPLEFDRFTRMQELTRMMAESVNDVATVQRAMQRAIEGAEDDLTAQGRQARDLQRELLRTRMVEFDSVAERLYAVVRQAARETGKQVRLDIVGGTIEMDRGVLERMAPAFEHLLRNCVGHGIESAADRAAAGKPPVGTIVVTVGSEGNDVSVEFRDDGAGLRIDRIRERALAQGLIAADAVVDADQAGELIFLPGFSTATQVTGLSGRGIGMDVVRAEVQALGGRIETASTPGQGTAFRMVLPLTTAVTQVVMVRVGTLVVGVPANLIEVVRRVPMPELQAAYAQGSYQDLPLYWGGALLQASTRSVDLAGKTHPVLIARSASQRVALHVDEVLGNQEVVVKNLGPQLSRLPGLAGMSVLASGAVVLIYNPVALATVYGEWARGVTQPPGAGAVAEVGQTVANASLQPTAVVPLVLVVDDSITVRRVTQRLLQREGYRVALAADGLQALQRLREERPVVVLSDIEMPRMDGFDLVRAMRADPQTADLPVVMITSRMAQKHRDHAMELGVSHYLGKPYSDDELLGLVRHYAVAAEAVV
ncbi:MAG: Hpt domain-containing protein [Comamonadaceae bacterium]|nr:Hpt domain-containing protein [Burkholderiales bacterium]MEB2348426.1 Hpt domain-containing protein [Comamonadaceae bacterium]